jgi:hypothetical protein
LVQLGASAERYFQHDPAITIIKLRQFAELLSKSIDASFVSFAARLPQIFARAAP